MSKITIWHNPRCSKSREALKILEENNADIEIFKYLTKEITQQQIKDLLKMLGIKPRELMRTKESIYKELDLKNENDEQKLIEAMVKYPKLIQRAIVIKNNKAIIARPPEIVKEIL
jgi:arsenate reductase